MRTTLSYLLIPASLCSCIPLSADVYRHKDHVEFYGDFLFMQRTKIHNKPLVENSLKHDHTVMNTKDLVDNFDFEPGYRVGILWTLNKRTGFEGNYLYLQPWEGKQRLKGDESLSFPFTDSDYDPDFTDADRALAKYRSQFWDAELNYWDYFTPRRVDYFSLSGIIGLRYFQLDESFKLEMTNPPDKSNYNVHTNNRIGGLQVGLDFEWNPTHWLSWEFMAKVGGMVDWSMQRTFLGDMDNEIVLRDFKRHKTEWGIFTDVLADFSINITRFLSLRFGYQMLFFSGLTLAPEQISKRSTPHAGDRDYAHGNAIIHGMFGGGSLNF